MDKEGWKEERKEGKDGSLRRVDSSRVWSLISSPCRLEISMVLPQGL